jgi:transposase
MITHQPYPSDVSDAEWAFVVPYLCLLPEDSGQRVYNRRDVFDGQRWIVRSGSPWRYLPKDFPPWEMVYRQSRRWLAAGCFEAIVHDLRAILRFAVGRNPEPTAAIFDDGRTLQSTPESGPRASYDGYKRRKGSKVHMAVDTLGHLLALHVTPPTSRSGTKSPCFRRAVQKATGQSSHATHDTTCDAPIKPPAERQSRNGKPFIRRDLRCLSDPGNWRICRAGD